MLLSPESGSQVVPAQQPAHELPPHVHIPPAQDSPLPHVEHARPPVPHAPTFCAAKGTHVLPLQQPLVHVVASQMQAPAVFWLQSWPVAQAAHAAPPVPHEVGDSLAYGSQVPADVQHPVGHVFTSQAQTPPVVSHSPLLHEEHVAPAVPHCVADSDA
jgi:hypothetical protein